MPNRSHQKRGESSPRQGRVIRDRTIGAQGFDRFVSSSVEEGGQGVALTYRSGARYLVPLEYLLCWYTETHNRGKSRAGGRLLILRSRMIANGRIVRVYLSDGRQYDVLWDTVLMACEPLYEHYGGLTPQARELTRLWAERHGSFQITYSPMFYGWKRGVSRESCEAAEPRTGSGSCRARNK
jgi:hypothetical protein